MIDPVTTRYVEALFGLAKKRGLLAAVESDVEVLAREMSHPNVANYLLDARVPAGERLKTLRPALEGMNELTRDFVALLFDKRRERVLSELGPAFHRRLLEERGAAEGVVESARPLPPPALERIGRTLGARMGKVLELENRVRPELLGGVRVIVESRMVDGSIAGRLNDLEKRLREAPLPSSTHA